MVNLSPGITFTVEVQAYKDDQFGKPATLLFSVPGKHFSPVSDFKATLINNTSVELSWNQPSDLNISPDKIMYGIYYGFTVQEVLKGL